MDTKTQMLNSFVKGQTLSLRNPIPELITTEISKRYYLSMATCSLKLFSRACIRVVTTEPTEKQNRKLPTHACSLIMNLSEISLLLVIILALFKLYQVGMENDWQK